MKEIIINTNNENTENIMLIEDGELTEYYNEEDEENVLEGNIYCGIVKNILPGMQSAFVDIGKDRNAFLHIKDILPKMNNETGNKEIDFSGYKVEDYVKTGMPILVQVKKDEEDKKGARISTNISLTGRFCVLMVKSNFITVSKKIEDENERGRLKNIVEDFLNENSEKERYGIIIRTAAKGKKDNEIIEDINKLVYLWKMIEENFEESKKDRCPQLICQNYDITSKFLTGVIDSGIERIVVNNQNVYEKIGDYLKTIEKDQIELKIENGNLIKTHGLEKQVEKMEKRKVWLKCGGFITIDKTEALTAIDVNSGKFTGKRESNKEDTILKVNEEATVEIAKQLRLRNISGIIVVDYIDMENDDDRNIILQLLEKQMKKDRSKNQIIGFTKLDLLELTRKKM